MRRDTNLNPEMDFRVHGTATLSYNIQADLQGECRKREEVQLQKVFERMDLNGDRRVCSDDLQKTLEALDHSPPREEIEIMLWEVDDAGRGYLTAAAFTACYYRIRESTEPDEPRAWFR